MQVAKTSGDSIPFTAASDYEPGSIITIGSLVGVVNRETLTGELGEAHLVGVFEAPKAAVAVTAGAECYFDSGAGVVTTASSGNTLIGHFTEDAADTATRVKYRLKCA